MSASIQSLSPAPGQPTRFRNGTPDTICFQVVFPGQGAVLMRLPPGGSFELVLEEGAAAVSVNLEEVVPGSIKAVPDPKP